MSHVEGMHVLEDPELGIIGYSELQILNFLFSRCLSLSRTNILSAMGISLDELSLYENVAVGAALKAGEVIARNFFKLKTVENKGKVDLVTETDKACEKLVFDHIKSAFPSHLFIGEEDSSVNGTAALTDAPTWMVDPLDGTTNYVHMFPFVCVSIALVINKQIVVGVVYNPILKEMFTAKAGQGAFLNGNKLHVSHETEIGKALLATEVGTKRDEKTVKSTTERINKLLFHVRSLRLSGSCAMNMCGVACGRLDIFYEIGFGGPWDVAAGALILKEAGGQIFDPDGGEFDLMANRLAVCSTTHLKDSFLKVMKNVDV